MAYAEFPSTDYSDHDLREIIALYKKVKNDYKETLETITTLNRRLTEWETSADAKLNSMVSTVRTELVSQINQSMQEMQNKYNSSVEALMSRIDSEIQEISSRYGKLEETFNSKYDALEDRVNSRLVELNNNYQTKIALIESRYQENLTAIESKLEKQLEENQSILMLTLQDNYNELKDSMQATVNANMQDFIGQLQSVEDVIYKKIETVQTELVTRIEQFESINNIQDGFTPMYTQFGVNCIEWYNMTEITCAVWNCTGITCAEWAVASKFTFDTVTEREVSPISGYLRTAMEIVLELITYLKVGSIEAEQHDRNKLTAEEYDNMHITALEYDFRGGDIL